MELNDLNRAEGAEVPDNVADAQGRLDETEENERISLQHKYGGRPNPILRIVPISTIFPTCQISWIFPIFLIVTIFKIFLIFSILQIVQTCFDILDMPDIPIIHDILDRSNIPDMPDIPKTLDIPMVPICSISKYS